MTNGVAHAAAAAPAPAKSGSGHGARRHDASGFGKALEAEGFERERGARAKPDADAAPPSRWSRAADLLSSTLVPATDNVRPDTNATAREQLPGADAEGSLPDSASKAMRDWADLPQHAVEEREDLPLDSKADDGQEKVSQAKDMPGQPARSELPDADRQLGAPVDDPLAELKLTLAGRNTDKGVAEEPVDEAVADAGGDGDVRDDPEAVPAEAPRARIPEPLIYLAAITPAEKSASPPTEAGKTNTALANRGREAQPRTQPSTQASPVASVVVELVAGAKQAGVQPPAVGRTEATRANTAETASTDDTAAGETSAIRDKPREPSGQSAAVTARPPSPPAEPAAPPAAQSAGPRPEHSASDSLGDGEKPEPTNTGNSAAPEPRRSGDQPVAAPRVEVLAEKAFVAPPAQPANPTVTSLAGAIAASSASHRAADAAQIGGQADANGTRTLQIQLNPADLGVVTAHLKTSGERLSIELRVDTAEAYYRLTRDSDAIVATLKGHGYDIDSVTILQPQAAPTPVARADTNPSATGTPDRNSGQLASGGSGSGGNGASGQSSGRQENGSFQGSEVNAQTVAGRSGDGVYI